MVKGTAGLNVVLKITAGHDVPEGTRELLERLFSIAGLDGTWTVLVVTKIHAVNANSTKESERTIQILTKPGDNNSRRALSVRVLHEYGVAAVYERLQSAANKIVNGATSFRADLFRQKLVALVKILGKQEFLLEEVSEMVAKQIGYSTQASAHSTLRSATGKGKHPLIERIGGTRYRFADSFYVDVMGPVKLETEENEESPIQPEKEPVGSLIQEHVPEPQPVSTFRPVVSVGEEEMLKLEQLNQLDGDLVEVENSIQKFNSEMLSAEVKKKAAEQRKAELLQRQSELQAEITEIEDRNKKRAAAEALAALLEEQGASPETLDMALAIIAQRKAEKATAS